MLEALGAPGPHEEHADKLRAFGRLVGSWDCDGSFFDADGSVRERHRGEWHFGWVLGGRAVQDVLISPPRGDADPTPFENGTTLRVYDPRIDRWRIWFASAVTGSTVALLGRENGDEIWLEGRAADDRLLRWTFSDVTEESVRWQGFVSTDRGLSWVRDEQILLTRRA